MEALKIVKNLINRLPSSTNEFMTSMHMQTGHPLDFKILNEFRCVSYALIIEENLALVLRIQG